MTETSEGGDKEEYNPVDVWLDSVGLPGLGSGEGWGQSCISTLLAAKLFDIFFLNGSETNRLGKHSTELTHTHTLTALILSSLWGKHTIPEHQHTSQKQTKSVLGSCCQSPAHTSPVSIHFS